MKELSRKTQLYIWGTILPSSSILIYTFFVIEIEDIWMMLALSMLASLARIFKTLGATERSHYNISFVIYSFTLALLGIPEAILVILISNLVDWAWHKYPWYIQTFNIGSYVIVVQLAGLLLEWVAPDFANLTPVGIWGVLLVVALFTFLNHLMVGVVVWLARGQNFKESGIFDRVPLALDFTMLGIGFSAALIWEFSPYAAFWAVIPLYLLYHTIQIPRLERKTETDSKTGLYNANYFARSLKAELARANRFNRPLTVVMADLDLLRNINNSYGHLAGDEVIIGVANILRNSIRDYDVVARFGGEEFSILMPETEHEQALSRIEKIREAVETTEFNVPTHDKPIKTTMSFGISGRSVDSVALTATDLIHQADLAVYQAKLEGRNCARVYVETTEKDLKSEYHLGAETRAIPTLEDRVGHLDRPYTPSVLREAPELQKRQASATKGEEPDPGNEQAARQYKKGLQFQLIKLLHNRLSSSAFVNVFVGFIALLTFALMFLTLPWEAAQDWLGLGVFALLVIIAEGLSIDIYVKDSSISTSAVPILASVLLFGPPGVLISGVAMATVAMIKHRSQLSRFIFNSSNQIIGGIVAWAFANLIINLIPYESIFVQVVAGIGSVSLFFLSTTYMVAIVIDLNTGESFVQVWQERFRWMLTSYMAMGVIAYSLTVGYQIIGLWGIVLILIPVLTLRYSQALVIARTTDIVIKLRGSNEALRKQTHKILSLNDELLNVLAHAVDLRDPYVQGHSQQVARYASMIGEELGLEPERVMNLRNTGLLHDIGKLGVPDSILFKQGKLTRAEYEKIMEHPILGAEILQESSALSELIPFVRHHHERFNGNGYPDKLKTYAIPLEARILAVADAVEAMATDRPYRKGFSAEKVMEEIALGAGVDFDPEIVAAFLRICKREGKGFIINSAQEQQNYKRGALCGSELRQQFNQKNIEV